MDFAYTPTALADLEALHEYIQRDNQAAARKMVALIREAVEVRLVDFPEMGRRGRVEGTRELTLAGTPYFIVYRCDRSLIEVIAIIHSRRRWPPAST